MIDIRSTSLVLFVPLLFECVSFVLFLFLSLGLQWRHFNIYLCSINSSALFLHTFSDLIQYNDSRAILLFYWRGSLLSTLYSVGWCFCLVILLLLLILLMDCINSLIPICLTWNSLSINKILFRYFTLFSNSIPECERRWRERDKKKNKTSACG